MIELDPVLEFSAGKPFALPWHLVQPHAERVAQHLGCTVRPREAKVEGLVVDVVVFPGKLKGRETSELLSDLVPGPMPHPSNRAFFRAELGNRFLVCIAGEPCSEIFFQKEATDDEERKRPSRQPHVQAVLKLELDRVACLTGQFLVLNMASELPCPPLPVEPGRVDILLGSIPPGEYTHRYVRKAFGLCLEHEGKEVWVRNPTKGRGVVVKDDQGEAVVQIIDRTVYFLYPVTSYYHQGVTEALFRHGLVRAMNALRDMERGKLLPPKPEFGLAPFVAMVQEDTDGRAAHFRKRIKEVETEIDSLRSQLESQYRQLLEFRAAAAQEQNQTLHADVLKRVPSDYRRLKRLPLVGRVYMCEGGLQVETREIVVAHEGVRYPTGRFIVRFSRTGVLSIWAIETRHPDGVPHPHLRKYGSPCFGTASEAISRAAGEIRYADAMELILRWLTEGYAPEVASTKIETWPREENPAADKEAAE